jgi:hypothetical protein
MKIKTSDSPNKTTTLTYIDYDGARREVNGCHLTVDHLDRHWIWCEQQESNLVWKIKGRENALLASIDMLLFIIHLRDERIKSLQRIADLATAFADQVKPDELMEDE